MIALHADGENCEIIQIPFQNGNPESTPTRSLRSTRVKLSPLRNLSLQAVKHEALTNLRKTVPSGWSLFFLILGDLDQIEIGISHIN